MPTSRAYTIAAVLLIIGLILGYAVGLYTAPKPEEVPVEVPVEVGLTGTVKVGLLVDLSGALSTYGENSRLAAELAEQEINDWLDAVGADWDLDVIVEDTAVDPATALAKLQTLHGQGVRFVVGPMSSAEVSELKSYVDANNIILISMSSTSPALAIPGDNIFRFCPTDVIQGPAAARVAYEMGIRHLVIIWRGDTWGDGLKESVAESFEALGGVVHEASRYSPDATEFSSEVASLADMVTELVEEYGADQVGVELIAFKEAASIFQTAAAYEVLRQVKWIGSDGTAQLAQLIETAEVAEFAKTTEFINPIFAPGASPFHDKLRDYVLQRFGREPDAYAYATYDAIWALALSFMILDDDDPTKVKRILPEVVSRMVGSSGMFQLNEDGDRAFADYDLYVVWTEDGTYVWKKAGVYRAGTDTVEWADWWLARGS
jgi:branched-chain amino acid transport system substrate-binding protein